MRMSVRVGRWRGVPILVHWTTPLGFLLFFQAFRPAGWVALAALILMHEQGHAWLGRRSGLYVERILIHGAGGECAFRGYPTPLQRAIIAWGGVLGQLPALGVGILGVHLLSPTAHPWLVEVAVTFSYLNVILMGLNLLPLPGADGWYTWRVFAPTNLRDLWRSRRRWRVRRMARDLERKLANLKNKRDLN